MSFLKVNDSKLTFKHSWISKNYFFYINDVHKITTKKAKCTIKADDTSIIVDCVWNVMAHAQKPDFVFPRNGGVHLNLQGHQFSRILAAELCASAVVILDTPCSEVVKSTGYPLHSPVSPSLPLPCVTVCHHVSTGLLTNPRCKDFKIDTNSVCTWMVQN